MPADDEHHLGPQFMTPSEVLAYAQPGDFPSSYAEKGWSEKLAEAAAHDPDAGESLVDSVREYGVEEPIIIAHGENRRFILEGHRRIAAANEVRPDSPIPVLHVMRGASMEEAQRVISEADARRSGYVHPRVPRLGSNEVG